MNLKNTSIILKKINRLYELISDIGEASSTENDLMKAYTLDLYEAVTMSEIGELEDSDDNRILETVKKRKKQEKKIKKQIHKKEKEDAMVAEKEAVVEESPDPVQENIEEVPAEATTEKSVEIDSELLSLFEMPSGSELSDKLSQAPIKDLTKVMGINEKIFTINELFGGEKDEFENVMLAMNKSGNFEEAKKILIGSVAGKYEWAKDINQKKAKKFITLVQRRFK